MDKEEKLNEIINIFLESEKMQKNKEFDDKMIEDWQNQDTSDV